ncbi:Zinc transporter ZIP2, partial [Trichostrongylus colubriformis]
ESLTKWWLPITAGMNLNVLKIILLSIMIIATLVAGLAPVKVLRYLRQSAARASSSRQHRHVSLVLCLLTCFSGELVDNIRKLDEVYNFYIDYPIAELLSCAGFFLLFFLEEVVIMAIPSLAHAHSQAHGAHGHGFGESSPLTAAEGNCCMTGALVQSPTIDDHALEKQTVFTKDHANTSTSDDGEDAAGHCQKHCPLTVHRVRKNSDPREPHCTASNEIFTALAVAEPERCETNCERINEDPPILMKSSPHAHSHGVRSITFVLALSIHSVIEGVALGVGDNASETTALFLSLLVHKLIVAFSVGLQLARTHAHQLQWVVASVFTLALMSPLGAIIGMAVQTAAENSFGKDVAITILQGLAVGTFLYVTFFEVLLHERDNEHPNLLKLLLMLFGFSLIGLLRLIGNHEHGDFSQTLDNSTQAGMMRNAHLGHSHHHNHHSH